MCFASDQLSVNPDFEKEDIVFIHNEFYNLEELPEINIMFPKFLPANKSTVRTIYQAESLPFWWKK